MVTSLGILEKEIGTAIFNSGVVHFGEFSWHVHKTRPELELPLAPIFIDLSGLPQELVTRIGVYLHAKAQETIRFEKVAGVPTGGNGFAKAFCIAARGNKSQLLTLQKTHKILGPVEGSFEWHSLALPIEDVTTTGASTLEAIEVLGAEDLTIRDVVTIIDYELGATERLKANSLTLHHIFPISQLLSLWFDTESITSEQYDKAMAFFNTMKTKLALSL